MGGRYEQARISVSGDDRQEQSRGGKMRDAVIVANLVFNMPWHCQYWTLQQLISTKDEQARREKVILWEENMKSQFSFVAVASTLTASVVVGSIAWAQTSQAHWTVTMLWYGALLMSLWCVIIAFHLGILFSAYDVSADRGARLLGMIKHRHEDRPRKKSLNVLQMPIALFSWGIISYIIGLAILILEPLWKSGWVRESWVAIGALVYGILTVAAYLFIGSTIYGRFLPDLAWQDGTIFP